MKQILKQYFGYTSFRKGQAEIIEKILAGRDVLGIMPTGGGKSLCYQIPALIKDGVTIVVSPLISLMKDQVDDLSAMGIEAAFINSSLTFKQLSAVLTKAQEGAYKLIYIAPERLENEYFLDILKTIPISIVAVDEAHCVSQWGHDFRPSYTRIAKMVQYLPERPIVTAFTATATPEVKADIIKLLELKNPYLLTTGFDRENLYFEVVKPNNKFNYLLNYVNENREEAGIIYCSTRKNVDSIYEKLDKMGLQVTRYHAGLSEKERTQNQEEFLYDRLPIMIATNAFGMGIDKSNLRYVIHYNMPKNMESYYQEAGRAGRDGARAECILMYSAADIITNKFLIEKSGDKSGDYDKLQDIIDYCNTDKCLRAYILNYFGEQNINDYCGNCGNCNNDIECTDITIEAQKIMSCIKRMDESFGSGLVTDVLRGANTQRIRDMGFNKLSTYGIMKEYSKDTIKEIISFLIAENYIGIKGDKYPILKLNLSAYYVLKGEKKITIKRVIVKQKETKGKEINGYDHKLFANLRQVRKIMAEEQNVPPFIVFSDASLIDMCRKYPMSEEDFLNVSGVGENKLVKYGKQFLSAIRDYVQENSINVNEIPKVKLPKSKKEDTRMITYELYTSGKNIAEIMEERGLTRGTIEGHLFDCLKKGLELDYEKFFPVELEPRIIEAIKKCGTEKLKPIKEMLPEEVSYAAIKFMIWKQNSQSS